MDENWGYPHDYGNLHLPLAQPLNHTAIPFHPADAPTFVFAGRNLGDLETCGWYKHTGITYLLCQNMLVLIQQHILLIQTKINKKSKSLITNCVDYAFEHIWIWIGAFEWEHPMVLGDPIAGNTEMSTSKLRYPAKLTFVLAEYAFHSHEHGTNIKCWSGIYLPSICLSFNRQPESWLHLFKASSIWGAFSKVHPILDWKPKDSCLL